MTANQSTDIQQSPSAYEYEIQEAEKLVQELENLLGAQQLGDEVYESVKQELAQDELSR